MAKFKADITFKGIKEKQVFEKNEEFEMTIKRSEEITENITSKYPDIKVVMTRIDGEEEAVAEEKTDSKPPKSKKE